MLWFEILCDFVGLKSYYSRFDRYFTLFDTPKYSVDKLLTLLSLTLAGVLTSIPLVNNNVILDIGSSTVVPLDMCPGVVLLVTDWQVDLSTSV